jgi:polar amino acid transport system substrate-binding protein
VRKRKSYVVACALLIAIVAIWALVAGCGGQGASGGEAGASSAAVTGTPLEIATKILGHAPTGLAKTIVDRGSVLVANDADYAPQSSIDKATGKPVGFDVDAASQTGKILGLRVGFRNPAWETVPAGLQRGKFDVSIGSMAVTPELAKALSFTDPYYYTPGQVIVRQGGAQIARVSDLNGKTVGVAASSTFYDFLKRYPRIAVRIYGTDAAALSDLSDGNLDFVVTASSIGRQAITSGQPFAFSGKPLHFEDLAFAIKKGEPDWLSLLDYAVRRMHTDGTLTAMSKKWYDGLDLTVKR